MAELLLVTGGARSGKSRFAEQLAARSGRPVVYVATMEPLDDEVRERIALHRERRDVRWTTVEAPRAMMEAVGAAPAESFVLVDCVSLWVSNRLIALGEAAGPSDLEALAGALEDEVGRLAEVAGERWADIVLVTNEVGSGLVPEYPLGRAYRDLLGRVNQRAGALAARAWLLVAGRPLPLPPPFA